MARSETRPGECLLREYSFVTDFVQRCLVVKSIYYQFILQLRLFQRLCNYLKDTL